MTLQILEKEIIYLPVNRQPAAVKQNQIPNSRHPTKQLLIINSKFATAI